LTRLLLKYGADPDMRDKRGVSVHRSARDPEVRAVLDEHRREKRALRPTTRSAAPRDRPATKKRQAQMVKKKR
jgi:hypothetical protein